MEKVKLAGLRVALRKFDENGRSATDGRWLLGRGRYDLLWEVCYKQDDSAGYLPIIDCVPVSKEQYTGALKNIGGLSEEEFKRIANVIMDEYNDVTT